MPDPAEHIVTEKGTYTLRKEKGRWHAEGPHSRFDCRSYSAVKAWVFCDSGVDDAAQAD